MTENPQGTAPDGNPQQQPSYPPPPAYGSAPAPAPDLSGYQVAPGAPGVPGGPAYAPGQVAPVSASDERMWGLFAHLGGVLVSFVVPLVIFLMYKDRSAFLRDQAAEALNWQITIAIGYVISFVLMIVLIGFLTFFILAIASLVFGIIGGIAANRGERYRYPFALRLVH